MDTVCIVTLFETCLYNTCHGSKTDHPKVDRIDCTMMLCSPLSLHMQVHEAALFNLGILKMKGQDLVLGLNYFEDVLALNPQNWRAALNRARALLGIGRIKDGQAQLFRIREGAGVINPQLCYLIIPRREMMLCVRDKRCYLYLCYHNSTCCPAIKNIIQTKI